MMFIKTPIKGCCDYLPNEIKLREYVKSVIVDTYTKYGFTQIETPIMEHISNLTNKQGGENEKLIFKILKRGEKLDLNVNDANLLTDSGLRYDLTVPLARYYANNANFLNAPFKALQIGPVFRADRPQKGRLRQFVQCDIDILGEDSNIAEIDLIQAISEVLSKLKFKKFTIRINDRRILKAMALYAGFNDDDIDSVLISLDKLDKIGFEGVMDELINNGYAKENVEKYLELFKNDRFDIKKFCDGFDIDDVVLNLVNIIDVVNSSEIEGLNLVFDPTLVRGMSYYTGPIFEISLDGYNGSCGGGGRYDEMISKFSNVSTSACGFSIGFERILLILQENNFKVEDESNKIAIIIDKDLSIDEIKDVYKKAKNLRNDNTVLVTYRKKNAKYQKEYLINNGYTIEEVFKKVI
ncbi:MAG: histidine--tRNA ligase [Bacilli bacterium]|nr:histidine--tRNA ligase [Bacilli bacterium]